MTQIRFRQLLIIYLVVLLGAVLSALLPPSYSDVLKEAYDAEPDGWLIRQSWLSIAIAAPLLFALCAGFVGLYMFKGWGRSLSLAVTIIGTIITLLIGPSLSSPLEDALGETLSMLWGSILAAAYWSPVGDRFSANNSFKPSPHQVR